MNPDVLERVLSCEQLPSLPAVAARVIELTSNDQVSMREIADTIQNDQGLSAKILKTVNSSFYGLRKPCGSITQAIVMLGLSAVKALALGFSLVSAVDECNSEGFDIDSFWRRSLLTGVAARRLAMTVGLDTPEECFLGGLLQDVGVVALFQSMPREYGHVLELSGGDHRELSKHELDHLEMQHAEIGAMLARRWKLPEELVMPIRYHERATAAPAEQLKIVECVGLGNFVADVISSESPAEYLRTLYKKAKHWLDLSEQQVDEVISATSTAAKELGRLLKISTGEVGDSKQILARARAELAAMKLPESDASPRGEFTVNAEPSSGVDELTGLASRRRFDQTLIATYERARAGGPGLCLALLDIDGLREISEKYGDECGDALIISAASRLREKLQHENIMVARYSDTVYAVLVAFTTNTEAGDSLRRVDAARLSLSERPVSLIAGRNAPPQLSATFCVGISCLDSSSMGSIRDTESVIEVTERALAAAKQAGPNNIRVFAPTMGRNAA